MLLRAYAWLGIMEAFAAMMVFFFVLYGAGWRWLSLELTATSIVMVVLSLFVRAGLEVGHVDGLHPRRVRRNRTRRLRAGPVDRVKRSLEVEDFPGTPHELDDLEQEAGASRDRCGHAGNLSGQR